MRIRALAPIVGSYPCKPDQATGFSIIAAENAEGEIVSKKRAYRAFTLRPEVVTRATPKDIADDQARVAAGEPSRITSDGVTAWLRTPGSDPIDLPDEIAADLIARGLAEAVDEPADEPARPIVTRRRSIGSGASA